jgi:hypothetical protein
MANRKHLEMLQQGTDAWNTWRKEYPRVQPDLSGADLSGADLSRADLSRAILSKADLSRARFFATDLSEAILSGANLSEAHLSGAHLSRADLSEADLSEADLGRADLSEAWIGGTVFGDVDLRPVKGLDTVQHAGPSHISTSTLVRSDGDIPEIFLRGAGLPDTFISSVRALVSHPIEYYTCFISYSSRDQDFAERLNTDLQGKGVRCWFAPEDLKIGEKIRPSIDKSIHQHDKLLLVLSQHSIASTWVEKEVETAFGREAKENKLVLFPVRLDDVVKHSEQAWAADIRRMRHIGDFSRWKEHVEYQKAFTRLLRDLQASASTKPQP